MYLKVWLPLTELAVPCVFYQATGIYCPGCGMTRALLAALQADAHQAFRYNALLFLVTPLLAVYLVAQKKRMVRTGRWLMAAMLVMTLGYGLLRNIPDFSYLAPTKLG